MDDLQPKSSLYTDYQIGKHGADSEQPVLLQERQGLTMLNLVVFNDGVIDSTLKKAIDLPLPTVGQSSSNDHVTMLWIGSGRYLIVSTDSTVLESISDQIDDQQGALQDLSSARTVVRIQGEACRSIMAKGLNLPLDKDSFQSEEVILSSFDHHYPAIIHNVSDDQDKFDIYVTRSFALSFWQWLCDSSLEYGYEII